MLVRNKLHTDNIANLVVTTSKVVETLLWQDRQITKIAKNRF